MVALTSGVILTVEQRSRLNTIIDSIFKKIGRLLGCAKMFKRDIKTSHPHIRQQHYLLSPAVQAQVNQELEELLKERSVERLTRLRKHLY